MIRFKLWVRRFSQLLSVSWMIRSPVVALTAAHNRSLPATAAFLKKHGCIVGTSVSYGKCRFRVIGRHYNCLPYEASLIDWGMTVSDLAGRQVLVTLPTGLKFVLGEHELTTGLAMLEERFVLEECAALTVGDAVVL